MPLEVIIRNISAGSFAKRFGVEEGIVFDEPTIEFSYKNDDLHDPLMNAYHAVALKLATWEEIELIKKYAFAVNDTLKAFWSECGVTLVDFKLEFGKTADGAVAARDRADKVRQRQNLACRIGRASGKAGCLKRRNIRNVISHVGYFLIT